MWLEMRASSTTAALFVITALLMAHSAAAVTFRVTELECPDCAPEFGGGPGIGGSVTIGFRVEGPLDEEVLAIDAAILGYDESVADFASGSAVAEIYHAFADPDVGAFGGMRNFWAGAMEKNRYLRSFGSQWVWFLGATRPSLDPNTYNPLDPGLDGVVGGGDAQFRATFVVTGPGVTTLSIGTVAPELMALLPGLVAVEAENAFVVISADAPPYVVPEPNVAVLLGLGLAGISLRGVHRHRK